jgi:hypothetical protein
MRKKKEGNAQTPKLLIATDAMVDNPQSPVDSAQSLLGVEDAQGITTVDLPTTHEPASLMVEQELEALAHATQEVRRSLPLSGQQSSYDRVRNTTNYGLCQKPPPNRRR